MAASVDGDLDALRTRRSVVADTGWKIHISSCGEQAERVLDATWEYCTANRLAFKFLRGRRIMTMQNSKYALRGSSGKLVTIYPEDEAASNSCSKSSPRASTACGGRTS